MPVAAIPSWAQAHEWPKSTLEEEGQIAFVVGEVVTREALEGAGQSSRCCEMSGLCPERNYYFLTREQHAMPFNSLVFIYFLTQGSTQSVLQLKSPLQGADVPSVGVDTQECLFLHFSSLGNEEAQRL